MMTLMTSKMEVLRYLPSLIFQISDKILKYSLTVDKKTHLQINLKEIACQKMLLGARTHKGAIRIKIGCSNSHLRIISNRLKVMMMKKRMKALVTGQMALLMQTIINNPNYLYYIVNNPNLIYLN